MVFAKMPHGKPGSTRQNEGRRAPQADIGTWRTATIDTKRRNGCPVRLFGDVRRQCPPQKKQQRPTQSAGLRSSGTTSNRGLKKVTVGPAVRSWKLLQVNGQQFAAEAVES